MEQQDVRDLAQGRPAESIDGRDDARWTEWRFQPALLDQAQVGIIVTDIAGTIRECNLYAESMYRRPRSELIGADAQALAGEFVTSDLAAEIAAVLVRGDTWEGDFKIRRADGTVIDVHAIDSGILNADGRLEGIISVSIDITARRRAERRVALQHAATRVLVESQTKEEACQRILPVVCEALEWPCGAFWEVDAACAELVPREVWYDGDRSREFASVTRATRLPAGSGLPGRVLATRKTVWIPDVGADDNFSRAGAAAAGGLHAALGVPVESGGEMVGVLEFFGTMVEESDQELLDVMDAVGHQLGQFVHRRQAEDELREREQRLRDSARRFATLAETLQESLLPAELPAIPGVELAAVYRPGGRGERVGGDFYDCFARGKHEWALVLGDVCGKGPEAAAHTALVRYTIRASAMHATSPSAILSLVNDTLLRQDVDRFASALYARLRPLGHGIRVTVAAAGHPLPVHRTSTGEVAEVGGLGRVLGVMDGRPARDRTVELTQGDALVLFTDGVTDARRGRDRFGEERLADLVRSTPQRSASELATRIRDAVDDYQDGDPQDDLALLVVQVP
jgi:phosphoserine phosphatase RsbU/P